MRAKLVNEALRLLSSKDLIDAICVKLKKAGKSGDAIKPDNWRQQNKRGSGIYESDFFNQTAGITITVEYTDDSILEVKTDDTEESYSPFGNKSNDDSETSNDFFSKFSKEREKEKEIFSHAEEYKIKEKTKKTKRNKEIIFKPAELLYQIINDKPVVVLITPKDNPDFDKQFFIADVLFGEFFKAMDVGVWASILEKNEAEKFLKKIGLTQKNIVKIK